MTQTDQPPILVRDMTAADAPEVARLFAMLGYPWSTEIIAARIAAFVASNERGLVAVRSIGETGNPLLAVATLHVTPVLHRAGPVGRVTALVVDDSARGQGIGRAIMDAAEAIFVARGCVLVEVTSNKRRTDAHVFYEKLGYTGTSFRFGKPLTPAN